MIEGAAYRLSAERFKQENPCYVNFAPEHWELQCQTLSPDFVIVGFSGMPPTMVANLKTYSFQKVVHNSPVRSCLLTCSEARSSSAAEVQAETLAFPGGDHLNDPGLGETSPPRSDPPPSPSKRQLTRHAGRSHQLPPLAAITEATLSRMLCTSVLQDIHRDSSPFLLQPFHELSNGFWPHLTSPHPAIQFVPKMFYRVEVGALGGPVQSANIVVGRVWDLIVEWREVFAVRERCVSQRCRGLNKLPEEYTKCMTHERDWGGGDEGARSGKTRGEDPSGTGTKRRGKQEIPEKTSRPTASSGTIPTCENQELTGRGLNPCFYKPTGAAVAQWLGRSPPTTAIRVHSRIFARGNRAGRCRLPAGFLGVLPFPPSLAFQHRSILGSDFMSCPGIMGTYVSRLESPSLGECCLALDSLPTRHNTKRKLPRRNWGQGGTERLNCSPPTKANRVQSPTGPQPAGRFSRGSPVSNHQCVPALLHCYLLLSGLACLPAMDESRRRLCGQIQFHEIFLTARFINSDGLTGVLEPGDISHTPFPIPRPNTPITPPFPTAPEESPFFASFAILGGAAVPRHALYKPCIRSSVSLVIEMLTRPPRAKHVLNPDNSLAPPGEWVHSEETWEALNIEVLRADESEASRARNARAGETGDPPISDILGHDSHVGKSGSDQAGNRTRFALVEGE
ncbi:hypothetical protein PR048_032437 [Dryococelus australis]|uniref:Uncharacterized protein n=1 Tax=Dryococelus australis TaxID=614101 RepID=A0ABQ9G5C7_9NEOP|nr:hypothetical protein PR048_032437 [Dryococelus australis]